MNDPTPLETIPYATVAAPQRLEHDRRGWLIAFGVVNLLIGAVPAAGAMLLVFMIASMLASGIGFMPAEDYLIVAAVVAAYTGVATIFIWAGVASIRCRRWVRPVVVGIAWPVVLASTMGVAGFLLLAIELEIAPPTRSSTIGFGEDIWVPAVLLMLFGVLGPGLYLWFYSRPSVRWTLEAYDPRPSWTERCPLSVFVGCAALVLGAAATLLAGVAGAVPAFGTVVRTPGSWLLVTASALLMLASAVLMFRRNPIGWWAALAEVVGGFMSAFVTFCRLGMIEFYRRAGASAFELEELSRSRVTSGAAAGVFTAVAMGVCIAYLLAVRPHFRGDRDGATPAPAVA